MSVIVRYCHLLSVVNFIVSYSSMNFSVSLTKNSLTLKFIAAYYVRDRTQVLLPEQLYQNSLKNSEIFLGKGKVVYLIAFSPRFNT